MTHLQFALTSLFTLCFAVWVNLNYTQENVLYWPVLFASPFVFMLALVIVSKTVSGFFGLFSK